MPILKRSIMAGGIICAAASLLCVKAALPQEAKSSDSSQPAKNKEKAIQRLSKDVTPINYDLSIEPDMKKFTFAGTEEITLHISKPVRQIVINCADLKVSQGFLWPDGNTSKESATTEGGKAEATEGGTTKTETTRPEPVSESSPAALKAQTVYDAKNEQVRFVFKDTLPAGKYKLACKFNGSLGDRLSGFYRSYFEDDEHVKHPLCATQMEPMDARRMFPCFDEPEFKATYHLKATIDPIYVAISNSPIEKEGSLSGKKIVSFEPTPKMATYLFALIIGEFKATGEKVVDGVPIKVWAVSGKEHLGQYALEEAAKILAFERNYFGIAYPNKKLDLIALPDFEPGGMENLGAITFSDSLLLADEKTGSIFAKKDISSVAAHEIAHQWFGDLVTMRWWDALWLNEAFASWMATKTTDALHPEWRVITEAVAGRGGMSTDALETTRAVHAEVTNAGQVTEMFDNITYDKGESVLRMLEAFVGKKAFQKGVNKYLSIHAWSNATSEDLWNAIVACAPGVPVAQIMKTFINQPGVPVVYVDLKDNGQSLSLSQARFFPLGDNKNDKSHWLIPMVIRQLNPGRGKAESISSSSSTPEANESKGNIARVLSKKQSNIGLGGHWPAVIVNASGMGYYHTCYSTPLLKKIESCFKNLTVEEKLIITSDVNALTLSGRVPVEESYNLALNLPHESDPLVLSDLIRYYSRPHLYMTDSTRPAYEKLVRYVATPLKNRLGWNDKAGESEAEKHLRSSVLELLGTYGQDKKTIEEASKLLDSYIKDHRSVDPNIIETVLNIATYNGGIKEYEQLLSLYKNSPNPEDKNRALFSLAEFRDKKLARRTLNFALTKAVRTQDGIELLSTVAAKRETRAVGWPFIESHWGQIMHKFPEDQLRSLAHAASNVETRGQEAEVRSWFAHHPIPQGEAAIARMEEGMNLQLLRHERFGERIKNWTLAQAAKLPKSELSSSPRKTNRM